MGEGKNNVCIVRVLVEDVEPIIPQLGGRIQIVRAPCNEVVMFAAILTLRSFERGTNHAKTLGGELLLRLTGTLQIKDAIREVGISQGDNYLVFFGSREECTEFMRGFNLKELPSIECARDKMKTFFENAALVEVL
ncbi:KEOPS complex subunit Cgi121 [Thermococcus sp.]|uniref:KEOPS complex subunit Cgi121 n=1 Tax=Thermococcus sp. TaxID=35749 RepID=UPI0025F87082|nr:KEOPS complex subunit Cgi121 [Thermococcus sp.]